MKNARPTALEFFAGGGFARLGLEADFQTVWANDIDPMKAAAWRANFGEGLHLGDVWDVDPASLPAASLAWASFPCQDLSLAGARAGLAAPRSGAFFGFTQAVGAMARAGRAPQVLCLENVSGLLTSGGGADFTTMIETLDGLGYRCGVLELDAAAFVPQSRPRVFVVAAREGLDVPESLRAPAPGAGFGATPATLRALGALPDTLRAKHVFWRLPAPAPRNTQLADVVSDEACCWWPIGKTAKLIGQLSPVQRQRLVAVQAKGARALGAVYRRMRVIDGVRQQRAEARFDGLAGCLRTPAGGSSRQFLLFVEGTSVRVRALTAREALALMGVGAGYALPKAETAGLKIAGDGVCVPVVRWLSAHPLAPLAGAVPARGPQAVRAGRPG